MGHTFFDSLLTNGTNNNSMLQQIIDQFGHAIDNFYVLFIFDQPDTPYDYMALFQQHLTQGTIFDLDYIDTFSTAKGFVLSETAYLENENLFYKLRLQARDRTIEKLAKSVIFYVVAQSSETHQSVLNDQKLLDDSLIKTKKIIKKLTFIGDPITWDVFYSWYRHQIISYIFEEIIFTIGINGIKDLTTKQLNDLFFELLTKNITENEAFVRKISHSIDLYIQEWLRKIINELNLDKQTYLRIENAVEDVKAENKEKDFSNHTTIPNHIYVMNSVAYQAVREAIYRKDFIETEPGSWPKSMIVKGNTQGHVQIIPKLEDDKKAINIREESLTEAWGNVQALSSIDVDVLDILCSVFLHKAKHPEDIIEMELVDFLVMRGLKAKLGGKGRRGGYEAKQKEQIITSLKNIQSLWLTIDRTVLYKNNQPIQVGVQGRTFLFKNQNGKEYVVNEDTCGKTISFTIDKVFAKYLSGSQRQVALLPIQALKYHSYRFSCEKQLCRYLSWRWRTQAHKGNFLQPNKTRTLLEATGETLNERSPSRSRERFEKALDQLMQDGIIAAWHYTGWDETIAAGKGWTKYWLNSSIMIEPPDMVKEHYRSIEKRQKSVIYDDDQQSTKREEDIKQLGKKILACRKERNLTLLQLAELLQVSAPYISNIERNQANPSSKLKTKIIEWLEQAT